MMLVCHFEMLRRLHIIQDCLFELRNRTQTAGFVLTGAFTIKGTAFLIVVLTIFLGLTF
jgi:hypothetical protein